MPGYWMYETSGVLKPVVMAYLRGEDLSREQIATMRAYLRQWIMDAAWQGGEIDFLRDRIEDIQTMATLRAWLSTAESEGIDPL